MKDETEAEEGELAINSIGSRPSLYPPTHDLSPSWPDFPDCEARQWERVLWLKQKIQNGKYHRRTYNKRKCSRCHWGTELILRE